MAYIKESTIAFLKSISNQVNSTKIVAKSNSKFNTTIKTKTFKIKK